MNKEIERKFLVKKLPDLSNILPKKYERYYLDTDTNHQVRVQMVNNKYELETKCKINDFEYKKEKEIISKEKFMSLSSKCEKSIIRESYLICKTPNISIKKYLGDYEGLYRVEIEFNSIGECTSFEIPEWFGMEITGTKLALDSELIQLNRNEFLKILNNMSIGNISIIE